MSAAIPASARVTVDGRSRGDTPLVLRDLPPGDHEVLLEAGPQKIKQTVRIEPGITSQLVVPLGNRSRSYRLRVQSFTAKGCRRTQGSPGATAHRVAKSTHVELQNSYTSNSRL